MPSLANIARQQAVQNKIRSPQELERNAGFNRSKLQQALTNEQLETKRQLVSIIPKFMKAPIILASTHGAYDLGKEPQIWTVPANTYIFETQSIGDTTLTTIDDPIWKLSQSTSRPWFINYFLGNKSFFENPENGPAIKEYTGVFKNFVFYKPGDQIAERDLSIGGGRKAEPHGLARESYVNMGFYKFNMEPQTPNQNVPVSKTRRRCDAEILKNMRTTMVEDEDFSITNRQLVELINNGLPVQYKGIKNGAKQLQPAQSFTYVPQREKYRIFIFSSCAVPNCNFLTNAAGKEIANPYKSPLCNQRIKKVEAIQAAQHLKLAAMGIQTGPQGAQDMSMSDNELLHSKKLVESHNLRFKSGKGVTQQGFALNEGSEEYAMLNDDVMNWWELVDEEEVPAKKKPFNSIEKREALSGGKRRTMRKRRK